MKNRTPKILGSGISVLIIGLLILAGGAKAFNLGLIILDNFIIIGEPVNFIASAEIEDEEILDIKNFTFTLTGPENLTCSFFPNGSLIDFCDGVSIEQIENTTYQFGYGFLPGFLKYNITIDSATLEAGVYKLKVLVSTNVEQFESSEEQIVIIQETSTIEKCSIRAKDGEAVFEEETFSSRNKLNLFVPSINAHNGKGTFTAQEGRNRLSYKFDVKNAFETDSLILFEVSGELRVNRVERIRESSIILLNKNSDKVNIDGEMLDATGMDVSFLRC